MASNRRASPTSPTTERSGLRRLVQALDRATLRRVGREFGVDLGGRDATVHEMRAALEAAPHVSVDEIARDVLRVAELVGACRALGLPAAGSRRQLARTISRALRWRTFEEARAFVRSLGLIGEPQWEAFKEGLLEATHGLRPDDVPGRPQLVYGGQGWVGLNDFLGHGRRRPKARQWRSFEEARAFARSLGLRNVGEWQAFCAGKLPKKGRRPPDIPVIVSREYAQQGYAGMSDFLGTGRAPARRGPIRPFEEARAFARSLGLPDALAWRRHCKAERAAGRWPQDVPASPYTPYKEKGWQGYGDWLGTGVTRSRQFRPFAAARAFARTLGLRTGDDWVVYARGDRPDLGARPVDVPFDVRTAYRDTGWTSWADFLGRTGPPRYRGGRKRREWRPFEEARAYARGLGLADERAWRAFAAGELAASKGRLPEDVPADPRWAYREQGFCGFKDWLGVRRWAPFAEARAFARSLRLESLEQWWAFSRGDLKGKGTLPPNVPSNPQRTYADEGWINFGDWLGTGRVARHLIEYRDFEAARRFARGLGLRSAKEWRAYVREANASGSFPPDLPANPERVYATRGWTGYGDWLGTGNQPSRKREFWPLARAQRFVRSLGLRSANEWRAYCRGAFSDLPVLPLAIPIAPEVTYGGAWTGWTEWLGTAGETPPRRGASRFSRAR